MINDEFLSLNVLFPTSIALIPDESINFTFFRSIIKFLAPSTSNVTKSAFSAGDTTESIFSSDGVSIY